VQRYYELEHVDKQVDEALFLLASRYHTEDLRSSTQPLQSFPVRFEALKPGLPVAASFDEGLPLSLSITWGSPEGGWERRVGGVQLPQAAKQGPYHIISYYVLCLKIWG
jgi:hypothetical protein